MSGALTVLAYHRIALPGSRDLSLDLIDAYPADFEAQMRFVAANYNVISSWDLVRALRTGYSLPARSLIITFDDGYRCFVDTALPVMRRLGLPVTLFVPTDYPARPNALFWWDQVYRALLHSKAPTINVPRVGSMPITNPTQRQAAYERLVYAIEREPERAAEALVKQVVADTGSTPNSEPQMLVWDEIKEIAAAGVSIGPHTRHHVVLAQVSPERIFAEIKGSWLDLQAQLQNPLPIFAYPNGKPHALNAFCGTAVKQAGLAGAFTMIGGQNAVGRTDPFFLHRYGMEAGESFRHFRFKLTAPAGVYRRLKGVLHSQA